MAAPQQQQAPWHSRAILATQLRNGAGLATVMMMMPKAYAALCLGFAAFAGTAHTAKLYAEHRSRIAHEVVKGDDDDDGGLQDNRVL